MATIEEVQQAIKSWAAGTYRGITTDTLGAPVDIINLAISPITKPLGIYSDNPAFGSKHLRQIAGMPTEDANIIETASGMTSPGGAVHAMIVGAARLGRAVAGEKRYNLVRIWPKYLIRPAHIWMRIINGRLLYLINPR
jgi:hypothetical protein